MIMDYIKPEERLSENKSALLPSVQELIDDQQQKLQELDQSISDLQNIYTMLENQLKDNLAILHTQY